MTSRRLPVLAAALCLLAAPAVAQEASAPVPPAPIDVSPAAAAFPGVPGDPTAVVPLAPLVELPPAVIAGTAPSQRPAGYPVVSEFIKPRAWYVNALHGVSEPYPHSLYFLDDEGAWFTPFNRPGMVGVYDIRGWHGAR